MQLYVTIVRDIAKTSGEVVICFKGTGSHKLKECVVAKKCMYCEVQ